MLLQLKNSDLTENTSKNEVLKVDIVSNEEKQLLDLFADIIVNDIIKDTQSHE